MTKMIDVHCLTAQRDEYLALQNIYLDEFQAIPTIISSISPSNSKRVTLFWPSDTNSNPWQA